MNKFMYIIALVAAIITSAYFFQASDQSVFDAEITVNFDDTMLDECLLEIGTKSDIEIDINNIPDDDAHTVTVNEKNKNIRYIVNKVMEQTRFKAEFYEEEKKIVIVNGI